MRPLYFSQWERKNAQELFKHLDRVDSRLEDIASAADALLIIASRPDIIGRPEGYAVCFLYSAIDTAVTAARRSLHQALKCD